MPLSRSWDSIRRDVGYAVRTLRAAPAFTTIAVALLALGIGANTAIFSVVSAVLLRPLPFPEPDRLVLLWEDLSRLGGPQSARARRTEVSPADYAAWTSRNRSFTGVAAMAVEHYNLTGAGDPEKLSGIRTTANLFAILGMQPIVGRTLAAQDDRADAAPVVVIDERLWRSRFAADPGLVGRTIHINGLARTVVGVVPADFRFPDKTTSLWVPAQLTADDLAERSSYFMYVLARLKPGVTVPQAQADMNNVARALGREFPSNSRTGVTVAALHEHLTRDTRPAIAILVAAVALVLLIAGANLANLLLTRGTGRIRELAVRQALGATRARVTRQLLTENAVLAAIGATLGVALSALVLTYLVRLVPSGLPDSTVPALDLRVLLFTAAIAIAVVLGFGAGPAFAAADVHLEAALRSGGRTTRSGHRLRGWLVVAELTLTVVLLVGAGLLLRSYANVLAVDPGFDPRNLLVAETVLSPSKYARTETRTAFYADVLERVTALPGVTAAGFANFPPFVFKGGRGLITAEGEPPLAPSDIGKFMALDRVVSPRYFGTLGVRIVRGRDFEDRDAASAMPLAIINRKMAQLHWPGRDPIGRRIHFGPPGSPTPAMTVVGVIADIHQIGLDSPAEAEVYMPSNQGQNIPPFLWPQYLVVRTAGDPLGLVASLRKTIWTVDADQAVSNVRTMSDIFDAELLNRSTQLTLVGAFAVLAFVMAGIGLYGVLAYAVTQRLPEIGVKMALGASRGSVVAEVVRSAMMMTVAGVGLGLATALALTRWLTTWLFDISPVDPLTFAAATGLLLVMALAASWIPALRGASVNPLAVLRSE